MLIVPASKVSVPLTVVMRTRSKVAEVALIPAGKISAAAVPIANPPFIAQVFVVVSSKDKVKTPDLAVPAATVLAVSIGIPAYEEKAT